MTTPIDRKLVQPERVQRIRAGQEGARVVLYLDVPEDWLPEEPRDLVLAFGQSLSIMLYAMVTQKSEGRVTVSNEVSA